MTHAHAPSGPAAAAFRDLRRALARRRLSGAGARTAATVLAIAAIVSAFAYWQARVPLDGLVRARGPAAGAAALAAALAALALAGAGLAAERFAALRRERPGPEWLALPAPPALVTAHVAAEARLPALAVLPPAAAVLLAGAGLLPASALALLAAAFALAWWLGAAAAVAAVARAGAAEPAARRVLPAEAAWLAAGPRAVTGARARAAAWRGGTPATALRRLDALAAARPTAARARLVVAGLLALAGWLAWFDGAEPSLRRAQAFASFAAASGALGAWAVRRACDAPPDLHRPLPVGLADAWRARALPLLGGIVALAVLHALAAHGLPGAARATLPLAWAPAGFAIAVLGLHYGLTLGPRPDAAETLYTAWLGVAVTASVMIPLLGWAVLAGGLVHSTLRLQRWWTVEDGR
jgi:hypothetical protein